MENCRPAGTATGLNVILPAPAPVDWLPMLWLGTVSRATAPTSARCPVQTDAEVVVGSNGFLATLEPLDRTRPS